MRIRIHRLIRGRVLVASCVLAVILIFVLTGLGQLLAEAAAIANHSASPVSIIWVLVVPFIEIAIMATVVVFQFIAIARLRHLRDQMRN